MSRIDWPLVIWAALAVLIAVGFASVGLAVLAVVLIWLWPW